MNVEVSNLKSQRGVSIVEILVVVVIAGIIGAFAIGSFRSSKLYNAENQAVKLIDMMREAQQRSLTQKATMRVEINSTKRKISLISENEPADANNDGVNDTPTATNDSVVRTMTYTDDNVFIGVTPSNMTTTPTDSLPILPVTFSTSTHPLSLSDQIVTMRFRSNGTVESKGNDAVGTGATPTGATIYVWTKRDTDASATPTVANILRAVTVYGSSGLPRLWKCAVVSNQCTNWTN